jgi:hypothetical protein
MLAMKRNSRMGGASVAQRHNTVGHDRGNVLFLLIYPEADGILL